MNQHIEHNLQIPMAMAGQRLDVVLAQLLPEYSRARLQQWVKQSQVTVDEAVVTNKFKVQGGEQVAIRARLQQETLWQGRDINFELIYEDEDILVVNKAPGQVVHPAAGHHDDTLVNALLNRYPQLSTVPRAGIVHRLDKDTSGLLVVAKSLQAHNSLVAQLQARSVHREYYALVTGVLVAGGTVDAPIGRHPKQRKKMAVLSTGKEARTHYRIAQKFRMHTLLKVSLETGRTHQIRVHLAYVRFPIVGDPAYGQRLLVPPRASEELVCRLRNFKRQALHAFHLELTHPVSSAPMSWEIPMAMDLQNLVEALNQDTLRSSG